MRFTNLEEYSPQLSPNIAIAYLITGILFGLYSNIIRTLFGLKRVKDLLNMSDILLFYLLIFKIIIICTLHLVY